MNDPRWKLGDVYTNGTYRWYVLRIAGDKAVLQSCSTEWARTILLTYEEWIDNGRWTLEAAQ